MSGNPPSAVADFFAAFETASRSMECPVAPGRAAPNAPKTPAAEPVVAKRAAAPRKRKNGLGGAGGDLGDVMAGWPPLHKGAAR
jgi:hypothetical protein